MLREIVSEDAAVWTQTLAGVKADSLAFLSDASPLSDLYYLPIRLVKTLGWIGLSILMRALLPGVSDSEDSIGWELAMEILDRYDASIVSVSDEQAPFLYVFLKACLVKNQRASYTSSKPMLWQSR